MIGHGRLLCSLYESRNMVAVFTSEDFRLCSRIAVASKWYMQSKMDINSPEKSKKHRMGKYQQGY